MLVIHAGTPGGAGSSSSSSSSSSSRATHHPAARCSTAGAGVSTSAAVLRYEIEVELCGADSMWHSHSQPGIMCWPDMPTSATTNSVSSCKPKGAPACSSHSCNVYCYSMSRSRLL